MGNKSINSYDYAKTHTDKGSVAIDHIGPLSNIKGCPTPSKVSKLSTIFAFLIGLWSLNAQANVVGNDTQNFNATTSGLDFVTVHSSETLEPGVFNFGLFLNHSVNTLPYFEDEEGILGKTKYSDSLLGADLNLGVGLLENWDIGISLPQILLQNVRRADGEAYRGQFSRRGNTEIRINTKYRLWGTDEYGVAVIGSANFNRLKNNPYTGSDAGPTYNLELAADTTINRIAFGVNAGYRFRKPGKQVEPEIEPVGDQMIASAAASYLFPSIDTKVIFELFGSRPAKKSSDNSDRLQSSAEALLGIKHDFTTNLAGHIGGGTELLHGVSSPDWRAYAGINYTIGPKFSKPAKAVNVAPKEKPVFKKTVKDPFAGPPKAMERIVIHDILFEFDSDHLVVGGADDTLSRLVAYLLRDPQYTKLVIEGHTDSIGPEMYNDKLSVRRSITIRKWLIEKFRLDPKKVIAEGEGERSPIADNGNYQGRQLNRRVEFRIYRDMK